MTPELADLLTRLGELAIKNTASAVFTRIQSVRARKQDESTVNELVEIINELVDEKAQLLGIARGLEDALVAQRVSDSDISYITDKVVPTVEKLVGMMDESERPPEEMMDVVKELLSTETFTILQLVGFNFKAAIGQPLTEVVGRMILSQAPQADVKAELQILTARRELAYIELASDAEAFARLQ
jgi:hypothetical protein